MRVLVYNLVLLVLAPVLAPWAVIQLLFVPRRRTGMAERFGRAPLGEGVIWIHAVSVGEVRAVAPMLAILKRETGRDLYLSTVTVTGQATARRECPEADRIFYFPLDLPLVTGRAIDRVKPAVFVTAETEWWPNFYRGCRIRGVPVLVVNGRISDRSLSRYRRFTWLLKEVLGDVTVFLMQSREDARRAVELGADPARVRVSGNTKYDRRAHPAPLPEAVTRWARGGFLMVAGSTHRGEEEAIIAGAADPKVAKVQWAIVPRHPERFEEVAGILDSAGLQWSRFSRVAAGGECSGSILLVDAMGVLEGFYQLGQAAFVGGSLVEVGGHNLLEPAMLGKPVVTGPHVSNFREIAAGLTEAGGCRVVADGDDLVQVTARLAEDEQFREEMSRAALSSSTAQTGASARNVMEVCQAMGIKID